MPEHPHPEQQQFNCVLIHCDWQFLRGELTDHQVNGVIAEHADGHETGEYVDTIVHYRNLAAQRAERIAELESALRGAALLQGAQGMPPEAGGLQVVRESHHGDTIDVGGRKGELVGKKITDPKLRKQLGLPPLPKKGPHG